MTKLDRTRMMLAVVAAFSLAVACGDDGDDDDDTVADAGTDGGPTGPESMMCGDTECEGIVVIGQNLDGCCPAGDPANDCGYSTENAALQGVGIRAICAGATTAAGEPDDGCPSTALTGVGDVPGCCQGANDTCGFLLNLTALGGPNFGCQPWQVFTDAQLDTVEGIEDPNTPQSCGGE